MKEWHPFTTTFFKAIWLTQILIGVAQLSAKLKKPANIQIQAKKRSVTIANAAFKSKGMMGKIGILNLYRINI